MKERRGPSGSSILAEARAGLIRAGLLLGVLFLALGLILTPGIDHQMRMRMSARSDLDSFVTGSVAGDDFRNFRLRRSVLE